MNNLTLDPTTTQNEESLWHLCLLYVPQEKWGIHFTDEMAHTKIYIKNIIGKDG